MLDVSSLLPRAIAVGTLACSACSPLTQADIADSANGTTSATTGGDDTAADSQTGIDTGGTSGDVGDSDTSTPEESSESGPVPDGCGNGRIAADEDCDGAELGDTECTDLGEFAGGRLSCADDCTFDTSQCFGAPAEGDIVITEIMNDPSTLPDNVGEWFELHNPTRTAWQLEGCRIMGNAPDPGFEIDRPMLVAPGDFVSFAIDGDPGFVYNFGYAYEALNLNNMGDELSLVCNQVEIDRVVYDDGPIFPDLTGVSMSLDPASYDLAANDVGANWCGAQTVYNADRGSPGMPNPRC